MADQTVAVESNSGSRERVALDLLKLIHSRLPEQCPENAQGFIDLYVDCLAAASGNRDGWK